MAKTPWWQKSADEIDRHVSRLSTATLRAMRKELEEVRKQVIADIATVRGDWSRERLAWVLRRLDESLEAVEARLSGSLGQGLSDAARNGQDSQDRIAQRFGEGQPEISQPLELALWTEFSMDLIRNGMTGPVKSDIQRTLRTAYFSGKSPFEVMRQIQSRDFERLTFKSKFHRAEAIVRTEYHRMNNMARFARLMQYQAKSDRVDVLTGEKRRPWLKRWVDVGDARVRPTHDMAGELPAIPVDVPFRVGGAEGMFPGDPSFPPQESINCRCVLIGIPPDAPLDGIAVSIPRDYTRKQQNPQAQVMTV